ncbi:DUF1499 domain-containing protein [Oceanibacterium hippocampi]|uniref:DUF1499 domain-containing protein n=1 Tax=Oceanibacterium hippocampi TaxID=745714 RepID=A0A1Y5S931_9PROT|nr:DUF1499 domain-containing protein [Oceanibacterium hippocampi]SLN34586.1 hypothetical protein OCH7691_01345 [Oceanibacterium hippocampi]
MARGRGRRFGRWWGRLLVGVPALGLVVSLLLVSGCAAPALERLWSDYDREAADFATLALPDSPNRYLVAPPGFTAATPDRAAPEFAMPAEALRDAFVAMLADEPDVIELARGDDGLLRHYLQRTPIIRWPDTVTVRFIALGEARSTLAIYSRSSYGYGDFGTNRARVEDWLGRLSDL